MSTAFARADASQNDLQVGVLLESATDFQRLCPLDQLWNELLGRTNEDS